MKKINIALIGCGRIAQEHLKAFTKIKNTRIQSVSDNMREKAESFAEQYGCSAYTDYRDMIRSEKLDAVIICTPPNVHSKISILAMSRGLHVLCEKPFALNEREAENMCRSAKKNKVVLMMASKFRFTNDVVKAKAIIESGFLGRPLLFENVFCSKVNMTERWNSKRRISGGGVLIDNGTHSVDIARFLLGPIIFIQAQFGCQVQKIPVEDTARIYFQGKSKIMGTIDLSWSLNKDAPNYMSIYGTEGTLLIGWKSSKYKLHEKNKWKIFGTGYDKQKAFLNQGRHFIDCITHKAKPIITPIDGLESVKVIEKVYESSRMNKWIKVG
ncbi:MAG: Gfo/Idh/MocA family oxidoreductase [Candidatus Omnitrophota bacterium]|nr:MAG: Gfo/Idh/MocA family oxidoreductase [Candidatus Omnitrophota bacterium]